MNLAHIITTVSVLVLSAQTASGQVSLEDKRFAAFARHFGSSAFVQNVEVPFRPGSTPSDISRLRAVERATALLNARKKQELNFIDQRKTFFTNLNTVASAGIAATFSPRYALIFGMVAQDQLNRDYKLMEEQVERQSDALLSNYKVEIDRAIGQGLIDFRSQADVFGFLESIGVTEDLVDAGAKDQASASAVTERLAQRMVQSPSLSENTNDEAAAALLKTSNELSQFASSLQNGAVQLTDSTEALAAAMSTAAEETRVLREEVAQNSQSLAIVADFTFSSMSSRQKVAALKAGFLSSRFACRPDEDECDASRVKDKLLKKYEADVRVDEFRTNVSRTVSAISDVNTITQNLGIDIDGLPEAARFAQVGQSAINAILSPPPNYLSAVAAVSSLFGKAVDPDAERHRVMMSYLQQEFEQVNARLGQLQEGQHALMEGQRIVSQQIADLGQLVQQGFLQLDEQIAEIDSKLELLIDASAYVALREWDSCMQARTRIIEKLDGAGNRFPNDIHEISLNLKNQRIAAEYARLVIPDCVKLVIERTGSLRLQSAGQQSFLSIYPNLEANAANRQPAKEILAYRDEIYQLFVGLAFERLDDEDLSARSAFHLVSEPWATRDIFLHAMAEAPELEVCSTNTGFPGPRALFCQQSISEAKADEIARHNMMTLAAIDRGLGVARAIVSVATVASLYSSEDNGIVITDLDKIAQHLDKDIPPTNYAVQLLEESLAILSVVSASHNLRSGPVVAEAVAEFLEYTEDADTEQEAEIRALVLNALSKQGGNLVENVGRVVLMRRFGLHGLDGSVAPLERDNVAYRDALDTVHENFALGRLKLAGLFGENLEFRVNKGNLQVLIGAVEDLEIWTHVPSAAEFASGSYVYSSQAKDIAELTFTARLLLSNYTLWQPLEDAELVALHTQ